MKTTVEIPDALFHDAALARLAEEERASRDVLCSVQGALREALLALPAEEYDWFDLHRGEGRRRPDASAVSGAAPQDENGTVSMQAEEPATQAAPQREFFEYAGPLYSVVISPTSSVVEVLGSRPLRAVARDRPKRSVEHGVNRGGSATGATRDCPATRITRRPASCGARASTPSATWWSSTTATAISSTRHATPARADPLYRRKPALTSVTKTASSSA